MFKSCSIVILPSAFKNYYPTIHIIRIYKLLFYFAEGLNSAYHSLDIMQATISLRLPLAECKRDNPENSSWKGSLGCGYSCRNYARTRYVRNQLLAHNVGVRTRGIVYRAGTLSGKGKGKEMVHVGSFFRRRAFSPGRGRRVLTLAATAQILRRNDSLRGNLRFYRKFIRGGGPCEPLRGNWINFVRSSGIHVQSRCDESRDAIRPSLAYTI